MYEVRQICRNMHSIHFVTLDTLASSQFEHCPPDGRLSRVHAWVKQRGLQSSRGLIFVTTRNAAEQAAAALRQRGCKAEHYHFGMIADAKARVMSDWQAGNSVCVSCRSKPMTSM